MTIEIDKIVRVVTLGDRTSTWSGAVVELDLSRFQSSRWALQLDSAFAKRTHPVWIVSHGVAALAVAWWAQLSPRSYMRSIRGGIFLTPLSIGLGQEGIAAAARGGPLTRLPFASIATASSDFDIDRMRKFANGWGSYLVGISPDGSERHATAAEAELVDALALVNPVSSVDRLSARNLSMLPNNVLNIH